MATMKDWEPVPVEVMIGCFVIAGIIVSIVYSIDWSSF
jgi:hypothetical protein